MQPILSSGSSTPDSQRAPQGLRPATPLNAIETYKASVDGNGLRIRESLPQIIERGADSLTPAEKELLKWVGVFFRRPTPGKFMMRVRMPNGFVRSAQLRVTRSLPMRLLQLITQVAPETI